MGMNEEFVISGISGRYPECHNVEQFKEALLIGKDLITDDERRYPAGLEIVPKRSGKLPDIDKFDASFFGVTPKQASLMDPQHRILLETVFEAIVDAGYNPKELRGSKTGVFVGLTSYNGNVGMDQMNNKYFYIITTPYHAANRISYFFDFKGPSFAVDTACSGSLYAFTLAYEKLRSGAIDNAVVCSANINFHPVETGNFMKMNVLNPEGNSQVFNRDRKGYVRSEIVSSVLVQKKSNCRRMYATVVGAKINADGYKAEGMTHPCFETQIQLIKELHVECNISPKDFSYMEMHGTGTVVGDLEETKALLDIFSGKRSEPLLIGSIKSNMGHSECGSGLASLTKLIIAMETGTIPATINVDPVDPHLAAMIKGTLEIATTNKTLKDGLLGTNSFGIGGANAHVVLKPADEKRVKRKIERANRLVQVSGRTEEAVNTLLDKIEQNAEDEEFLSLIDEIHKSNVEGYNYRGYTVLGSSRMREVSQYSSEKRPIWFIFSGVGSQWINMGLDLMHISVFKNTIDRCAKAVEPYGIDLIGILKDASGEAFKNCTLTSTAIVSVTVALVDLLTSLGIEADYTAGHSLGEIGCAYVNGDITPEQAALMAFARGYALEKTTRPSCQMAAIGLSVEELTKILPKDMYIACINGKTNITISGLEQPVKEFVQKLCGEGIFARLVDTANVAFHSPYLMGAENHLNQFLQELLVNPQPRLSKWISTCVPPERRHEEWAQLNGADYQTFNFRNPVRFDYVYPQVQKNAIVIEISPHALLQSVLKREMEPDITLIGLMNKTAENREGHLLQAIGKIFNAGGQPNLRNLYTDVTFPVSRGTKMLSPLITWDHNASWFVPLWKNKDYFGRMVSINLNNEKYSYISGHNIDGRILMPATGYVELVWNIFAEKHLKRMTDTPVVFENIRFLRAVSLSKSEDVHFIVNIMKKTGHFEILEGGSLVVTGKIRMAYNISTEFSNSLKITEFQIIDNLPPDSVMNQDDFYKELIFRRYNYNGSFVGVSQCNFEGTVAKLAWNNNFSCFMDMMLQLTILKNMDRDILWIPTSIKKLVIDPRIHLQNKEQKYINVVRDQQCNIIRSEGIELFCPTFSTAPRRKKIQMDPVINSYEFVCYNSPNNNKYNLKTSLIIATDIVLQNISGLVQTMNTVVAEISNDNDAELIRSTIQERCSRKFATTLKYSFNTLENISGNIDVLIVDESTPKHWKNTIADNKTFILYIGNFSETTDNLDVIFKTPHLCLLKVKHDVIQFDYKLQIRNHEFYWLEQLKEIARSNEYKNVLIYSENEENSGILGFISCVQTESMKFKCSSVFINQKAEPFSENTDFYRRQLSKNLVYNILFDNNWGTYVSLALDDMKPKYVKNTKLSIKNMGNLSSLLWMEAPVPQYGKEGIVDTSFFALNFKDVLIATGKLPSSDSALCAEYSGKTRNGKRVMGQVQHGLCTKQLIASPHFTWEVPESWSLDQAATVPVVYTTNYYGMILRGRLQENESILIHSGSGAIGISAIRIALSLNARIFTTVSTEQKKQYLLELFPQLEAENIGNSRDLSFYTLVKEKTKGKGVDMIVNSLAGEFFHASIDCLAECGRFIEIGRMDLLANSHIDTSIFLKNCSFHGILLDESQIKLTEKIQLHKLVSDGLASGVVQPISATIFQTEEVEQAFRYLSSGKHIGKVIIQVEKEEPDSNVSIPSMPKIYFDPEKVYIIIGGLGGMGLELAHWIFSRGARKVVLNARRPPWKGYQFYCMDRWSKLKYSVVVDLNSTITLVGSEKLLKEAQKLGPVGGYFNCALVLKDGDLNSQTQALFEEVLQPKLYACEHMDALTRKYCPELDHFVVFSSIIATTGIVGQTNYGMANSAMERLCEKRRRDNLPGLAIQWGPVADVGVLMSDKFQNRSYKHLKHQKIESCWKALERCMIQDVAVGSSVVLSGEVKHNKNEQTSVDLIAKVIGLKDIDSIGLNETFQNIGVDSLMLAEMKQLIYQEYQQELDLDEIRNLTFGKLVKMTSEKK